MILLLLFGFGALAISFFCSLLEAVLLSVTPSFVENLKQEGTPAGLMLARQKEHIHRPLAAILTLNTAAHTAGAAGVGAQAQKLWGSDALMVTSAVLTVLVLLLSEIIPKTLGSAYCKRLAPWTARTLAVLVWIFRPFVVLSEAVTGSVSMKEEEGGIDRDQIAALARLGQESGVLQAAESRIIGSIAQTGEVRVKDVMTPRTVVFSLPEQMLLREAIDRRLFSRFSRIPVFGESEDVISGYVLKDQLLYHAAKDQLEAPLHEFVRPMLIVSETQRLVETFEQMLERREHIALAVDEYGGVAGVVSMEDVLETLLGFEIVDEADGVKDMRVLARRRWVDRARRLGIDGEELGRLFPEVVPERTRTISDRAAP